MNMQHGRFIPTVVATAVGAALFGSYVAFVGLDADIGNSATLLAMAVAVFIAPGVASAVFMDLRGRHQKRVAAPAIAALVTAERLPFPAAEAVADVRSLTEARVERRYRNRRAAANAARRPMAMG